MATILLPCDGSADALLAVRHVVQAFHRGEVERVHLLNVQPPFTPHIARYVDRRTRADYQRERAGDALAQARQLLAHAGVPHRVHIEVGDRVRRIDESARRWNCDRIVIGTPRKSALVRAVGNSLTTRLIERSEVPVVVIGGAPAGPLERLGIPAGLGAGLALLWAGAA